MLKTALENKAELEMAELKQFLLEKGKNNPAQSSACQNKAVSKNEIKENPVTALKQPVQQNAIYRLSIENTDALQQFNQQLALKAYEQTNK
jgi:hypothetical protein